MKIYITKYIVKQRHPYHIPARYSSNTMCRVQDENMKELFDFSVSKFGNFKKSVLKIKAKLGEDNEYIIDEKNPYVHYL